MNKVFIKININSPDSSSVSSSSASLEGFRWLSNIRHNLSGSTFLQTTTNYTNCIRHNYRRYMLKHLPNLLRSKVILGHASI